MIERVIVVAAVAALVVVAIVVVRKRPVVRSRPLPDTGGLPPGVYLLTSDGCAACGRARDTLTRRGVGYTELSWEKNPEIFERSAIDAVPSVLRVDDRGGGTWFRGGVPRRGLGTTVAPGRPRPGESGNP